MKPGSKAALSLFVLSPLIAEYLLGSLPTRMLGILPLMAMLYGSGAILVREYVRRKNLGWPALFLLAAAYGLAEEGLVTQSLFNPNYLHLRLLDYGWVPAFGTSPVWLIYVIGIHVFGSIGVPIGFTESLFPPVRDQPWLGKFGLILFAGLLLLGSVAVASFTYKQLPFLASPAQFGCTVAVIVALVIAARLFPRRESAQVATARSAELFGATLAAGSAFMLVELTGQKTLNLPWPGVLLAFAAVLSAYLVYILKRGRNQRWTPLQRFAFAAGGVATYGWVGFPIEISLHGTSSLPGHVILAVAILALLILAGRRSARAPA